MSLPGLQKPWRILAMKEFVGIKHDERYKCCDENAHNHNRSQDHPVRFQFKPVGQQEDNDWQHGEDARRSEKTDYDADGNEMSLNPLQG